jgi:hypothetical protein
MATVSAASSKVIPSSASRTAGSVELTIVAPADLGDAYSTRRRAVGCRWPSPARDSPRSRPQVSL